MKPLLDNWSIVIVGAWNVRIFNVTWLGQFIFPGSTVNAAVSLVPGFPTKFIAEDIELIPTEERLIISATGADDDKIKRAENKAKQILGLLSHTPMRAVGVNLAYRADTPCPELLRVFSLTDDVSLQSNGMARSSCTVSRAFPRDRGTMNLILTEAAGVVDLQFNFHLDVENADQVTSYLENRFLPCKAESLEIARAVYQLELEED